MKDINDNKKVSFVDLLNALEVPDDPYQFSFEEYEIIGDTFEIYMILYASGSINIGIDEVKSTLSTETANYVSTGSSEGENCIANALKDALEKLPIGTNCISNLLFQIWIPKNMDSTMKEMGSLSEFINELSTDIDVCWGCTFEESLECQQAKVSLIAVSR